MTLTRQHFRLIAEVVSLNGGEQWLALARDFADRLAETNPNFKRTEFINACEPKS